MYWRFFIHYNTLRFRLNNLQDEEVALLPDLSYTPDPQPVGDARPHKPVLAATMIRWTPIALRFGITTRMRLPDRGGLYSFSPQDAVQRDADTAWALVRHRWQ